MAGSHVFLNIEKEEEEIEKLIQFLLEYKPPPKADNCSNSPAVKTPVNSKAKPLKSSRGRPKLHPPSSPVVGSSDGNIFQSSYETIIQCLQKLNDRNKALHNRVIELDSQISAQNKKIEDLTRSGGEDGNGGLENSSSNLQISEVTERIKKLENNAHDSVLNKVSKRIEKLENNVNSHLLLCTGSEIMSKIDETTVNGVTDLDQIKAELCSVLCGEEVSKIGVNSVSLSLYGKNRKALKIECVNVYTRNFLIKQARIRKPQGIYVTEFLTPDKVHIYRRLLQLRRESQGRSIKSIRIKGAKISCKVDSDDRIIQIDSLEDVENLKPLLTSTTTTPNGDAEDGTR